MIAMGLTVMQMDIALITRSVKRNVVKIMDYHVVKSGKTVVSLHNVMSISMGIFVKREYQLQDAHLLDIILLKFNELS